MKTRPYIFLFFTLTFTTLIFSADKNVSQDQIIQLLGPEDPERGWVTPVDSTWQDWLRRTGEQPPDFNTMPTLPFLPDPLIINEGTTNQPVTTLEQWQQKRQWIQKQMQQWVTGTLPPAPQILTTKILQEHKENDVTIQIVEIIFKPDNEIKDTSLPFKRPKTCKMTIELMIPPGEGPFPVFMTQWNHRGWALIAVRRGYVGCVYAGADAKDDTDDYAKLYFNKYDFTRLMRRAWGTMRVIDYLYTLPFIDKEKIALTGHSRNGKQSLMAAAFDERIKAVVTSSGGTGAEDPFRFTSDNFDNETIAEITTYFPHWLHPRLRFFYGREYKLPVDQNLMMALVAPRGLMLSSALNESQGNAWGIQQGFESAHKVYKFLNAKEKIALRLRYGRHGTSARDIESYIDFFDYCFGISNQKPENKCYYSFSFDEWKKHQPADFPEPVETAKIKTFSDWQTQKPQILKNIQWLLGKRPAGALNAGPQTISNQRKEDDYLRDVIISPDTIEGAKNIVFGPYHSFGDYLYGTLYYPEQYLPSSKRLPVVIFLHEYDYSTGYGRRIEPFFERLVNNGIAVFSFDMLGFGSRFEEGSRFYDRYPNWSKMGKMVTDVQAAVNALAQFELVDENNIYIVGYSLGATTGLFASALDDRVAGMASICGFTPLRTGTPDKGVPGIKAFSHLHALLPNAGLFLGQENNLPTDFPEILSCIAPRSLLVVAPQFDRDAILQDVQNCVDNVKTIYGLQNSPEQLLFYTPIGYNKFSEPIQEKVLSWLMHLTQK